MARPGLLTYLGLPIIFLALVIPSPTTYSEKSVEDICNSARQKNGKFRTSELSEQMVDQCNSLDNTYTTMTAQYVFAGVYTALAAVCAAACVYSSTEDICKVAAPIVQVADVATGIGLAVEFEQSEEEIASQLSTGLASITASLTTTAILSASASTAETVVETTAEGSAEGSAEESGGSAACWMTFATALVTAGTKFLSAGLIDGETEEKMKESIKEFDKVVYDNGLSVAAAEIDPSTLKRIKFGGDLAGLSRGTLDLGSGSGAPDDSIATTLADLDLSLGGPCRSTLAANGDMATCLGATAISEKLYKGEFNDAFKRLHGTDLSNFVNEVARNKSDLKGAFTAAASGALGQATAQSIAEAAEAKVRENTIRKNVAPAPRRLASYSGGGGGGQARSTGGGDELDIGQLVQGMMGGLMPGQKGAKGKAGPFSLTFAKLQQAKPEEIAQDRSISLFTRVSYRYMKSKTHLKPMPWVTRYNQAITGAPTRPPAQSRPQ